MIDEVAGKLTSPFSGITAGSTSQWVIRGVGTLMALLVYGVGLGYLARCSASASEHRSRAASRRSAVAAPQRLQ